MALVAPSAPTGWSGFWNTAAPAGQTGNYVLKFFRTSAEGRAATALGRRGNRKYRAQMKALNGVAPGATTVDSYKRVQAVQAMNDAQSGGGKRTIETINNATTTTAGMVTAINSKIYDRTVTVQTYPRDLSGNGGGGKLNR